MGGFNVNIPGITPEMLAGISALPTTPMASPALPAMTTSPSGRAAGVISAYTRGLEGQSDAEVAASLGLQFTGDRDMDQMIQNQVTQARQQASRAAGTAATAEEIAAGTAAYEDVIRQLETTPTDEGIRLQWFGKRKNVRPELKAAIAGLAAPFIPGAAAGIAAGLGGGALASAATGAALGSGLAAATGQDPVKGALTGALGGFGKAAMAGQAAGGTSGIASLADTASTGASVADTASRTGGVLDVLGTAADIARSPVVSAAREYMEAKEDRPSYDPSLPEVTEVVALPDPGASAPAPPGVDIGQPVLSRDEQEMIRQQEADAKAKADAEAKAKAEREAAEAKAKAEADAKAKAEAEAEAEAQRRRDAEAKAKAEREAAEAKAKAEADAKAKAEAEAEAKRKRDAEAKAKAEREAAEAKAEAERKAAEEEAAKQQAIEDELIDDGWVRNGPWRYDGNGVFTHTQTGQVMVDPTVPEGAKVGDTFDAGEGNDSVERKEEEEEAEEEVVIDTDRARDDDDVTLPPVGPTAPDTGAKTSPSPAGPGTTPGTSPGTTPAPGTGTSPGGAGPGGGGPGGGTPTTGGGIQSLLPMFGLALLGRYLLGEAESGQRRGRLPLEQESATGYYNIDREVRRRMGLGG